jgi:hypothetical protein
MDVVECYHCWFNITDIRYCIILMMLWYLSIGSALESVEYICLLFVDEITWWKTDQSCLFAVDLTPFPKP